MSIIRYLFPKLNQVTPDTYWVHEDKFFRLQNPFDDTYVIYKVLEVKNGYVKYHCFSKNTYLNPSTDSETTKNIYAFFRQIPKPDWIK